MDARSVEVAGKDDDIVRINPTGVIIETKRYGWRGGVEGYDYRYEGGDIILISETLLAHGLPSEFRYDKFPASPGDKFEIGPFRFRVLERAPAFCFDQFIAIRERGVVTDLRYFWHRFDRLANIAYRRLIITLSVWRLAEYEAGRLPTWSDVYVLQGLKK